MCFPCSRRVFAFFVVNARSFFLFPPRRGPAMFCRSCSDDAFFFPHRGSNSGHILLLVYSDFPGVLPNYSTLDPHNRQYSNMPSYFFKIVSIFPWLTQGSHLSCNSPFPPRIRRDIFFRLPGRTALATPLAIPSLSQPHFSQPSKGWPDVLPERC